MRGADKIPILKDIMQVKDWQPRAEKRELQDHLDKMISIGWVDSRILYLNPIVAILSAGLIWGFNIWAMIEKEDATENADDWKDWIVDVWTWLYMSSQNVWIVILIYVMVKYWNLTLGKDGEKPEFSDASYFAMLFSCGVATGLWYFSAEAMWHYMGYGGGRFMDNMMFNDNNRAEIAMAVTWFHWGLHGWIPYVVIGGVLAFMSYRRGFPICIRFTLYPLIGEMCYGIIGDIIEVLSIVATIFGICTSLGLGAMSINRGMVRLDRGTYRGVDKFGCDQDFDGSTIASRSATRVCKGNTELEQGADAQIAIIWVITLIAIISVVLGVKRGIQNLSWIAFALSFFIITSILFMDETWYILNVITTTFGYYLWSLPKMSFHTDAWEELGTFDMGLGGAPDGRGGSKGWMNDWTVFYWGWWISWGPFVGTFLARISKNRTLGQFILACLILPSCWCFIFLGIFGAAQIRISNQAASAGLDGAGSDPGKTYGSIADKSTVGFNVPQEGGGTMWQPVSESTVYLYNLATEDVLFEHLQAYGGEGWSYFMTIITLICIVLYFVTSSDSASYVVDILASNGLEDPPILQRVFWSITEGAAATALLAATRDDADEDAALRAVSALPIVLGLPYTFLLFWMCQSLLILCKEESGAIPISRKNFQVFMFNYEPISFLSIVCPFVAFGQVAGRVWSLHWIVYALGFGCMWLLAIVAEILVAADGAFGHMGGALYFMCGLAVGFLRTSVRQKLHITGDMISDLAAGCFAFPFVLGQMYAEDFDNVGEEAQGMMTGNDKAEIVGAVGQSEL